MSMGTPPALHDQLLQVDIVLRVITYKSNNGKVRPDSISRLTELVPEMF